MKSQFFKTQLTVIDHILGASLPLRNGTKYLLPLWTRESRIGQVRICPVE
jgi:hypothetical protein